MTKHHRLLFVCFLNSFFLRIRHSFVPLLCTLSLLFSADCTLTARDLRYSHPKTPIIQICDKPLDVPDGVNLWGYNFYTKRLVTAEDPGELRIFDSADAFFEYDADAPASSIKMAPPEWGLTCAKSVTFLADESEFFPDSILPGKERCPKVSQRAGRSDPRLFAEPTRAKAPCDSPAQAKKKAPKRVHVCVRPPGVPQPKKDATGRVVEQVTEWGIFLEG